MYDLKKRQLRQAKIGNAKSFNHVTLLTNSSFWLYAQQLKNLSAPYLARVRDLQLPSLG